MGYEDVLFFFLPTWWQHDVLHVVSLLEQWGDFLVGESGDATADASHKEGVSRVLFCELYEFIHIRTDGLYTALHRGNSIALALQTNALSHDGAELAQCHISCTSAVHTTEVAAEYENLVWLE